jgi:hypothetical protein
MFWLEIFHTRNNPLPDRGRKEEEMFYKWRSENIMIREGML